MFYHICCRIINISSFTSSRPINLKVFQFITPDLDYLGMVMLIFCTGEPAAAVDCVVNA